MPYLKVERGVAECTAVSYAHTAPSALGFIYSIFIAPLTLRFTDNGVVRAAQLPVLSFTLVIPVTVIAITADIELIDALDGRWRANTGSRTQAAFGTFSGIDLIEAIAFVLFEQKA